MQPAKQNTFSAQVTKIGTIMLTGDDVRFEGFAIDCNGESHTKADHARIMLDAFYAEALRRIDADIPALWLEVE